VTSSVSKVNMLPTYLVQSTDYAQHVNRGNMVDRGLRKSLQGYTCNSPIVFGRSFIRRGLGKILELVAVCQHIFRSVCVDAFIATFCARG
jgi:hypothetical protein